MRGQKETSYSVIGLVSIGDSVTSVHSSATFEIRTRSQVCITSLLERAQLPFAGPASPAGHRGMGGEPGAAPRAWREQSVRKVARCPHPSATKMV